MSDAPPPFLDSDRLEVSDDQQENTQETSVEVEPEEIIGMHIRDEIFRLVENANVTPVGEFEIEGGKNMAIKGKVIVFQRDNGSRFIGFTNLAPDRALEMGIRTPIRNMQVTVGFAALGFNDKLDRYIGSKIGN